MKNIRLKILVLIAWLGLTVAAQAKINVVATTADLASLAHEVGGDHAQITTLTRPTEDPHFVDPKPSFIVKLNRADALIEGGAELELGWLPALLASTRNPNLTLGAPGRIIASQQISLLEVPTRLDRSQGDIHAAGNPHFLLDPLNALKVAEHICESLCGLDPKGCSGYRGNLQEFSQRLQTKLADWQKQLGPHQGKRVVAYHNIWPYFAQRFGLKVDLFLEPKPGIPPTPSHLSGVIARMKREKIGVVIVEPFQSRATAEKVARETGAVIVNVAQYPGGVKGTDDGYIQLMDYLVGALAQALED